MWFQNVWRWVGSGAPRVKVYRRSAVVSFANHANADATCWISFFANESIATPDEVKRTRRCLLAPYGDWPNQRGLQRFAREDAQNIVNEFSSVAKRALNPASWLGLPWYEGHPDHPDFRGKPGHGRSTAVGRIKNLEAGNDGLYADVKFNEDGEKLIVNESYHGHSVNWYLREDKNGALKKAYRPFSLKSVGFTNEPNIPVPAVTTANETLSVEFLAANNLRYQHMSKLRQYGYDLTATNAGTSEGAKKGWEKRSHAAFEASKRAQSLSAIAEKSGEHKDHIAARDAHGVAESKTAEAGMHDESKEHAEKVNEHDAKAYGFHKTQRHQVMARMRKPDYEIARKEYSDRMNKSFGEFMRAK